MVAPYESMSGSKPNTTKITSPLVKEDHPEIDDSVFQDKERQQYHSWIRQLQWAISVGRFDMPWWWCRHSDPHEEWDFSPESSESVWHVSKMLHHSVIWISTDEPDYSDNPRTEYNWEFSGVYRDSKRKRSRMMHLRHWANLSCCHYNLRRRQPIPLYVVCWQESWCGLGFYTCSTRPQPIGMRRSKAAQHQRRLPMVLSTLLREQRLSKSLTIACRSGSNLASTCTQPLWAAYYKNLHRRKPKLCGHCNDWDSFISSITRLKSFILPNSGRSTRIFRILGKMSVVLIIFSPKKSSNFSSTGIWLARQIWPQKYVQKALKQLYIFDMATFTAVWAVLCRAGPSNSLNNYFPGTEAP